MRSNTDDMQFVGQDLALGGYNYFAFLASGVNSRSVIMRQLVDETEVLYFYGSGANFATNWSNKATLKYILPSALKGRG